MLIILGFEAICFIFLYIKSRKIKCSEQMNKTKQIIYKMSLYILMTPVGKMLLKSQIQKKLHLLNPMSELKVVIRQYYAKKVSLVLIILLAGIPFITLISYSNQMNSILTNGNCIQRGSHGEEAEPVTLLVKSDENIEKLPYEVQSQIYSEKEIDQKVNQLISDFDDLILGDNKSFEDVRSDLKLENQYGNNPLAVEWLSDDYAVVDSDGKVNNQNLSEPRIVQLTAVLSYQDFEYEHLLSVRVCPKIYSDKEMSLKKIEQAIRAADQEQSHEKSIKLPQIIDEHEVTYEIKEKSGYITYLVIVLILAGILYLAKDNDLKKEVDRRNDQITLEYPEFVSQFVLLLGAGMTVRNTLIRMSQDSSWGIYLKQELQILVRDLHNGILEAEALDKFGKRCGSTLYIKFCALLIQNIKKGNRELLPMLEGEAAQAFQYRKQNAKKLGEEAGTKLLFPMLMMLGIVMVIIMVPAFLSFQL